MFHVLVGTIRQTCFLFLVKEMCCFANEVAEKELALEEPKLVEAKCWRLEERLNFSEAGQADLSSLLAEWKEQMEGPRRVD
jgi:hypothetical protein